MQHLVLIALISGAIGTGIGGVVGIILGRFGARFFKVFLWLAAAVMVWVSVFELLPKSFESGGFVAAVGGAIIGGLFVWGLSPGKKDKSLRRVGLAIFVAIVLHDFPEGLALGAGYHTEISLVLGLVILLHNIPEGMAIALPLRLDEVRVWKILVIAFVAGLPTLFGAIVGFYIGFNSGLIAYTFSFAAGAMLWVVLWEMT